MKSAPVLPSVVGVKSKVDGRDPGSGCVCEQERIHGGDRRGGCQGTRAPRSRGRLLRGRRVCGRSNGTVPLFSAARSTPSAGGAPRGGSCAGTDAGCPRCHGGCSALALSGSPSQTIPGRPRGLSRPRPWRRSNAWVLASMLCSEDGFRWSPTASSSARWSRTHRRNAGKGWRLPGCAGDTDVRADPDAPPSSRR